MKIPILDHGYIEFIESWGGDERIIESARMSTDGAFRGWDKDARLLAYLWNHKHMTPFEMAGITIEVQAPIFVFRQWQRHRTQSYNELSARYAEMPDLHYVPSVKRLLETSSTNKQAGKANSMELDSTAAMVWQDELIALQLKSQELYARGLAMGVAKETARMSNLVSRYSRMRASANLRNWLAFATLRSDEHAQSEIQDYSKALEGILAEKFPRTMELFKQGKK